MHHVTGYRQMSKKRPYIRILCSRSYFAELVGDEVGYISAGHPFGSDFC
jgi:hypothetical protein